MKNLIVSSSNLTDALVIQEKFTKRNKHIQNSEILYKLDTRHFKGRRFVERTYKTSIIFGDQNELQN